MKDIDPSRTAHREMNRLSRFGSGPLVCMFCGYADPVGLIPVTPEWLKAHGIPNSLFQEHHEYGEKHDPESRVPICRNCHAKATENLLSAGVSMMAEPNEIKRVALILDAMAVSDEMHAEARRRCANLLRKTLEKANE